MNVICILCKLLLVLIVAAIAGCRERELTMLAREAADRQAQQNKIVGRLVEENLKARRELLELQRGLQQERNRLNGQWTALESERKVIAKERRTESMLVAVVQGVGWLVLAVAAIGFAILVIFGLRCEPENAADVYDLIVQQVVPSATSLLMKPDHYRDPKELSKKEGQLDDPEGRFDDRT